MMRSDEFADQAGKAVSDAARRAQGIETLIDRHRRRVRFRVAGVVALLSVAAVILALRAPALPEVKAPSPASTVAIAGELFPLRLAAVTPGSSGLVIIDLEEGTLAAYPPGSGGLPSTPIDGAVSSRAGDWIVWSQGLAYRWAASTDGTVIRIGPEPRRIEGSAPEIRTIPTPSGSQAWFVQPGVGAGAGAHPTLVDLVPLDGGQSLLTVELASGAFPVAATDHGLVFNTYQWQERGGALVPVAGQESSSVLTTSGEIVPLGSGIAVAASASRIVRLSCAPSNQGCDLHSGPNVLLITDADGSNPIEVPGDPRGTWSPVGGPLVPGQTMPFTTVSPDGSTVLMRVGRDLDANGTRRTSWLTALNLGDGRSRTLAMFTNRPPAATWTSDGRWVALLLPQAPQDLTLVNVEDPETRIVLEGIIPAGMIPLAGG
jgi:hypothetical protein